MQPLKPTIIRVIAKRDNTFFITSSKIKFLFLIVLNILSTVIYNTEYRSRTKKSNFEGKGPKRIRPTDVGLTKDSS
ncbi:hypothetical protein Metme_4536 [Methylomonas methanica MC09]|uniref:Uncharacterized protein n=1 Tax=Methylomonas methanica (strain DSM 25384 / MC09) TaxID=857087 RepID=G0A5L8_METMM|nr:hypothetical protein Metme_4536 [Methylomonas methanica MC09]